MMVDMDAFELSPDEQSSNRIQIIPGCSFFKERRAPVLPAPADVRAVNKNLGRYLGKSRRSPPVFFPSLGLLVKYGAEVTIGEVQTQMMVYHALQGKVPIPEVFGWAEDEGQGFIYMEAIEGDALQERWGDMTEDERIAVCRELRYMVNAWRSLEQGKHESFIGSVGKLPLNDRFLDGDPAFVGPFEGENANQQFHDACSIAISCETDIVFTHDDLAPCNILLSPGPNPKVAAIIDWEQSGWYPSYWEYNKARVVTLRAEQFDPALQKEWHTKYLPMIVDPVDYEKKYLPWWYFVLSYGI